MHLTDEMVSTDMHKNIVASAVKEAEGKWAERYRNVENEAIRYKDRCEQLEKDISALIGILARMSH